MKGVYEQAIVKALHGRPLEALELLALRPTDKTDLSTEEGRVQQKLFDTALRMWKQKNRPRSKHIRQYQRCPHCHEVL